MPRAELVGKSVELNGTELPTLEFNWEVALELAFIEEYELESLIITYWLSTASSSKLASMLLIPRVLCLPTTHMTGLLSSITLL